MAELIDKWTVVNRLIDLENEFQQYKPFHGFEHAMYRKVCETEIAIGKQEAVDAVSVVRCKDCRNGKQCRDGYVLCSHPSGRKLLMMSSDFCSYGGRRNTDGN